MDSHRSTTPAGPVAAGLLLPVVVHGLGALDWQRTLRRTGMPFRTPAERPGRSTLAVGAAAAGSVLASAVAGAALLAVVGVPRAGADVRAGALVGAASVPLPLVGPVAGAWAEAAVAWRWARDGTADRSLAAARTGVGIVLFGLVHAGVTTAVERTLDVVLPPPPRPVGPAPEVGLNLVGPDVGDTGAGPDGFVVYLDGVGRCEARTTPVGRGFADAVAERLPRWSVVLSLMPNDVTQEPARARPVTGPLWARLHRADARTVLARGVWEALVALDPRYRGRLAEEHTRQVVAHLTAAGYVTGSGSPVVLVGLSGGAQTALWAASDVARSLGGAPLDVVTFGAFADGSAELDGVRRVHAVVSWGDPAELLPVLLFPSRWTALGVGAWRRAKLASTVVVRRHDFATHIGDGGYLSASAHAPDGRTRVAQAADVVAAAARQLLADRTGVPST